jgi:hypothetical protein
VPFPPKERGTTTDVKWIGVCTASVKRSLESGLQIMFASWHRVMAKYRYDESGPFHCNLVLLLSASELAGPVMA